MEFKDYYQILGVARDAPQDEIKRAYRKVARKYHPDVSKEADAETRFKDLGEAYEVLKDPEKRAAYDQLGANWQAGQDFQPPPDWDAGFEFSGGGFTDRDAGAFSDFFEQLFGAGGHGARRAYGRPHGGRFHQRGEDHHAKVLIDLEDSYRGATRSITLQVPELDNEGRLHTRERVLNLKVPKGILPGQHIRLAGQGEAGVGEGAAGDLYLEVQFKPHPRYRLEGRDLHFEVPVAPWEAALGATVPVPTPGGTVEMKIPPGTGPARKLRLKGRGLPGEPAGDLYVHLQVVLPPADSDAAKALYRQMAEQLAFDPRQNQGA